MAKTILEPELLQGAPLRHAPINEMGVVFLFSHLCRRMQIQVLSIQAGFPDCIALQRVGGQEKRIRIEFEYKASNFRTHGHTADECDWIVCWEHDWPDVPPHLKVVELREFFDHGFNVWIDVGQPQDDWSARGMYTFGKRVSKGDLVLFYEATPCQWLRQVYTVSGLAPKEQQGRQNETNISYEDRISLIAEAKEQQGRRRGNNWLCLRPMDAIFSTGYRQVHTLRRVCILDPPLHMKSLETKNLAIISKAIQSQKHNRKITEHWWLLYAHIIRKYPNLAAAFEPFSPSRV
jgi:hypothetical protein